MSLSDLDAVIDAAPDGMAVDVELAGDPRPLPAVVVTSACRIVEESLAEVGPESATVTIRFAPGAVVLRVTGAEASAPPSLYAGRLAGVADRVAAIGGGMTAGRAAEDDGGVRVQAWLPTEGHRS
jgi:hypothetical protein